MNEWQKPDGSVPSLTVCVEDEAARIARGDEQLAANIVWAVARWCDEVAGRPLVNVHRRTLDDTWRQVIRYFGGDEAVNLIGPSHDVLLMREQEARAWTPPAAQPANHPAGAGHG